MHYDLGFFNRRWITSSVPQTRSGPKLPMPVMEGPSTFRKDSI